jgi:hypothetical protein
MYIKIDSKKVSDNNNNNHVRKTDKSNRNNVQLRLQIISECMITQRTTLQTLEILADHGFKIGDRQLRRDKQKIKENNLKKLYRIAESYDFQTDYIQRMNKLEYLERGMFDDIKNCNDPFKRTKIRETIINMQPIYTAFQDAARYVIEKKMLSHSNIINGNDRMNNNINNKNNNIYNDYDEEEIYS